MSLRFHGTIPGTTLLSILLLFGARHTLDATGYRNFSLPCLAPLLEELDTEKPATVALSFLHGPWRTPTAREGLGAVSFPITTTSQQAQRWFNQGIALLHNQANAEAERSFRQALLLDPLHPMIFWGLAMANEQRPGRAELFARNAVQRISNSTSGREKKWIKVLSDFYNLRASARPNSPRSTPKPDRGEQAYRLRIRNLENLALSDPSDVEAKALLLRQLVLDLHRSGIKLTSHLSVDHLAADIHRLAPLHPASHYRIFLWLTENPEQARFHSPASTSAAPGISSSWRFAAEGWRASGAQHESIHLLEVALRTHHQEIQSHLRMPGEVAGLTASYTALGENLIAMGRLDEARRIADTILRFPRTLSAEGPSEEASTLTLLGRRLLSRVEIHAGKMQRVIDLFTEDSRFQPASSSPREIAQAAYWSGMALCALNRPNDAESHAQTLEALSNKDRTPEIIGKWVRGLRYFQELSRGKNLSECLFPPYFPAKPHAEAWQKNANPEMALKVARDTLQQNPRGLFSTALYCKTNFQNGNLVAASQAFDRTFRQNVLRADKSMQTFPDLDRLATALSLPGKWSLPPEKLSPELLPENPAILGPATWTPPAAPGWTLKDRAGRSVSLLNYSGKPLLLNFFLGVNCPFCLTQIENFRTVLPDFRKAGIEMVSISIDDVEAISQRMGGPGQKKPEAQKTFPFKVLADPQFSAFKNYGVFDQFEDGPMHGTFLISSKGHVLWSDLGHQPFRHPQALLEEAKRLIALEENRGQLLK